MLQLSILYFRWHYTTALVDLMRIWGNFFWFFTNFFSITLLLRTLFQPFRRLDAAYKKGFDPGAWAEQLGVNLLMRVVGALLRLFLIGIGLVALLCTLLGGVFFLVAWLATPFIVVSLIGSGLTLIAAY